MSTQSYYRWRAKYGSIEIKKVQRLRDLEKEDCEIKKLLADQMLKVKALEIALEKNIKARSPGELSTATTSGVGTSSAIIPSAAGPFGCSISSMNTAASLWATITWQLRRQCPHADEDASAIKFTPVDHCPSCTMSVDDWGEPMEKSSLREGK